MQNREIFPKIRVWSDDLPKELPSGCLDLWRVFIPRFSLVTAESVLSAEEKTRAAKYKFLRDRASYAVSRAALRRILARYLKENPRLLNFSYNSYGKPMLFEDLFGKLFFNVSHSGDFALIAVGPVAEIGVDVEQLRELDYFGLAENVFSQREQSQLRELPQNLRKNGFFTVWTRKEAFIKAVGLGLSFPLAEFDVSVGAHACPHITVHHTQSVFDTGWELHDIDIGDRYCAAVVVPESKVTRIRAYDFSSSCFEEG